MQPAMRTLLVIALVGAAAIPRASAQLFSLPALPYPYNAMEPAIDNQTMFLHWTRHTQSYATNLNNALATCPELQGRALSALVSAVGQQDSLIPGSCATAVRNQAGGLYNHLLFFLYNLAPYRSQNYSTDASPELQLAISDAFGSFQDFQTKFNAAAAGVFGSGWAWLVASPDTRALNITTTPNQDNPLMAVAAVQGVPLLGLDVWEHAYYLTYQNVRASYIGNFTDAVNWRGVSEVYAGVLSESLVNVTVAPGASAAPAPQPARASATTGAAAPAPGTP